LLATLAEAGGPYGTPALRRAWTDAYGAIAGLMKAGAAEAA
jgi:hemoglobin-like flavoprotein